MKKTEQKTPAECLYADIIDMPHPISSGHRPMANYNRAAQFASFDALSGFGDAVDETARLTDGKITLDEDKKQMLDEILHLLLDMADDPPPVRITRFLQDERKEGGAYVTVTGKVAHVDTFAGDVVLTDKRRIPIEDILEIEM